MNFIVCPIDRMVFRIELSQIIVKLAQVDSDLTEMHVSALFDNFRTVKTPGTSVLDGRTGIFSDFTSIFVYETSVNPPDLLVTKLFRLEVFGNSPTRSFYGSADVDLLTLATGPSKVALTLLEGDSATGRIYFDLQMSDQNDAVILMEELAVRSVGTKHINPSNLVIQWIASCNEAHVIELTAPVVDPANHNNFMYYSDVQHHYPLTLTELYNGAGFTMRAVERSGGCFSRDLGCTQILIMDNFKEVDDPSAQWRFLTKAAREGAVKNSGSGVIPPPPGADSVSSPSTALGTDDSHVPQPNEMKFFYAMDFVCTTTGGEDNAGEQFELSGRFWISKVPRFTQMKSGITVDGVVCDGVAVPGKHSQPPFSQLADSDV